MIKNIVFDLGGVVIDYSPKKTMSRYFSGEALEFIMKSVFFTRQWNDIDRGVTTPAEAFAPLEKELGAADYSRLIDIIENWGDYMPPFEETYELVKLLKKSGLGLYVLSNIPPYFHKIKEEIPALKLFDGFVISSDLKLLKPEPEIFEALLNKYDLKAEECYFIDDMQQNIDGAARCGIDGFCFNERSIPALLADLRAKGVSLSE